MNLFDNILSTANALGHITSYVYDALNRQTQENWLDATNTSIHTATRSYDAASQLTVIADPDSRYSYIYDQAGRLTSVDNTGTPGVPTVVLGYTYDAVNNKLTTTDTINGQRKGTESYTYDALDRVTRITQSGNGVTDKRVDLTYDAASQRTNIARYSDLLGIQSVANSDYSYDLAGRLTRLTHKRNSTTYADYQWTYDTADRITQFISPDGTSNYNYDNRDTDHSYQTDEAYSYDANGNSTNTGYQTGTNNQLLSDGTYSYTYDNEGNRTSRTNISTGEVTQYVWDHHNRLMSVITKDNSGTITKSVGYTYDVYNRRITKVIDPDGVSSAPAQTERMVYDGDNIALTFDRTGTQTHWYLYGPGVDQILADETLTSVNWALSDNQGSVRDVIDSNGVVLNHLIYNSYGKVTSETNPSLDFRFGYTGRERDKETGLDYNRARYYDTRTGAFIGQDPIGFKGKDHNLYRYVNNNPTNFKDPFGNFKVELRYRATLGNVEVLNRVTHADIVVTDKYGSRSYWMGPLGGGFTFNHPFGYLQYHTDTNYDSTSQLFQGNDYFIQQVYFDGSCNPNKALEQKIKNSLQLIENAKIGYNLLGPNSNSGAFQALRDSGLGKNISPKSGIEAPGWNYNPFNFTDPFNLPDPFYAPNL